MQAATTAVLGWGEQEWGEVLDFMDIVNEKEPPSVDQFFARQPEEEASELAASRLEQLELLEYLGEDLVFVEKREEPGPGMIGQYFKKVTPPRWMPWRFSPDYQERVRALNGGSGGDGD